MRFRVHSDRVGAARSPSTRRRHALPETTRTRHRHPTAGVQHQKTIKQTNEAVIRLDLEKKQAVRKADREHRTMLQYKTLLAESKTPLLLAQKEIASLQKELDGFRKAVDAKAKERDAMERAAKFAKAETEKVCVPCPCAMDARRLTAAERRAWRATTSRRRLDAVRTIREASRESRGRVSRRGPNRLEIEKQTTHDPRSRRRRVPSLLGAPRPHL